ncbi:hypothetical protein DNH61_17055 [Paenibacillus sambharensis]|uniref:O-antigen ligase-related domain-containing protein n=1 Tax=Paenibacillus sambharensis TaxID=1803190 RepID=A0A2W1LS57_9BACL|nr:O-antigen ligase family protein [Paenibacillus sambharensis]PZD94661.1 hypothetical protein DNH61_17055 [Paenibacillus sambharensis]
MNKGQVTKPGKKEGRKLKMTDGLQQRRIHANPTESADERQDSRLPGAIAERKASPLQEIVPAVLAAIVLITAAWRSGMYFDTAYYRWELAVIVASLLLGLPRLTRCLPDRMLPGLRTGQHTTGLTDAHISWLLVVLPLMAAGLYGISLAAGSVSVLGSIHGLVRWCSLGAFAMLLLAVQPESRNQSLLAVLQGTAAWIAAGSLAGWIGLVHYPGMVLLSDNAEMSALGARLAGFFEYPNMLGAVAGSLLLIQLLLLASSGSARETILPGTLAVWLVMVLLLTESRGAWIAVLLCWLAGLVWAGKGRRLQWLMYSGWTALGGAAGARLLVPAAVRHTKASGETGEFQGGLILTGDILSDLLLLFCLTVLFCGGCLLLASILNRQRGSLSSERRPPVWTTLLGSGVLGAAAWLLLPESLTGRLEGHGATASARGMLYRDGLELAQGAPWLGYGGDAWQALFQAHQDFPYVGAEVHSGYISLLLDIGAAGLLAVAAYIVMLLLPVWRHNRQGLAPLLVLVLHAAVDFDMSYGFYWLLLLTMGLCLGTAVPAETGAARAGVQAAHAVPPAASVRRRGSAAATGRLRARPAWSVAALCIAATLAAAAITAWRLDTARAARDAAAAAEGAARADALRAALAANPAWTRIRLELAPLAPAGERAALLAGGLRYEPQSAPLLWELGRTHAELGEAAQAAAYMRLALQRDRFDKAKQTEAVALLAGLADRLQAAGRWDSARRTAEAALRSYAGYEALVRQLRESRSRVNDRDFAMTEEASEAARRCRQLLHRLPAGEASEPGANRK